MGSHAYPQTLYDVNASMSTAVLQNCGAVQNLDQDAVCTITATNCPNLNLSCGNAGVQGFDCSLSDMAKTVAAVTANEDAAALLKTPSLGLAGVSKDDPNAFVYINSAIMRIITNNCFSQSTATQTLIQDIICQNSANVTANLLNTVSQRAACGLSILMNTVNESRQIAANEANALNTANASTITTVAVVMYCLFLAALLFGIGFSGPVRREKAL